MTIKKWGNSLATRIPKVIGESVDLHLDQTVEIEAVNGKIIITPVTKEKSYKLEELLERCPSGAMELDEDDRAWLEAEPVGREEW